MFTDSITSTLDFEPIPPGELQEIRAAGLDEAGSRLAPYAVAEGGSPLRCCLRETRPGDRVLLIAYTPPGPQRGDLADDISAALEASPAAGAFFDTLAQFYRKAYLRYIDATTRRPDLRAARIAEVVGLLADGIKERPRS
jgi:hypothetical protein